MALTEKPTALFSTHQRWGGLKNHLSEGDKERLAVHGATLVTKKRGRDGTIKVTGKRQELKATQEYTLDFGRAIVDAWVRGCVTWLDDVCTSIKVK